jgi:XTP/dITP diphosphohydrolase
VNEGDAWLLATRSEGKLRELRPMFAELGIAVVDLGTAGIPVSPDEDEVECFDSFEENAAAKARFFFARGGGLPVIADDSGLEVAALGGEPGVRSRRWSGRLDLSAAELEAANNRLLVERLQGVADRRARFVCVAAWCGAAGEISARGEVHGWIEAEGVGTHGFGYDPFFRVEELGMTMAEATREEKQRVSHRGRAFEALMEALRASGVLARGDGPG